MASAGISFTNLDKLAHPTAPPNSAPVIGFISVMVGLWHMDLTIHTSFPSVVYASPGVMPAKDDIPLMQQPQLNLVLVPLRFHYFRIVLERRTCQIEQLNQQSQLGPWKYARIRLRLRLYDRQT